MTESPESVDETRLVAIFQALAAERVAYAVFGGVALGLHGLARATADLDLFIAAQPDNVARLKAAFHRVFDDPSIDEISALELCGEYPAVRYIPPTGFGFDILTRLGEAFRFEDLDVESKSFAGVEVRVVTPRTLWRMKKGTIRPVDRIDAAALAERFGFEAA